MKQTVIEKKRSIGNDIFILFICVLTPVIFVTLIISSGLMADIRTNVLSGHQNSLNLFASQMRSRTESVEQYIYTLMVNPDWNGLRYPARTSQYEFAKTNLTIEIKDNQAIFFDIADGIYGYIPHTGEVVYARAADTIDLEENDSIISWMEYGEVTDWGIYEIDGVSYLVSVVSNGVIHIGIFIKEESIKAEWYAESELPIELIAGATLDGREEYLIGTDFLGENTQLAGIIPKESIDKDIPLDYYILSSSLAAGIIIIFFIYLFFQKRIVRPLYRLEKIINVIERGDQKARVRELSATKEIFAIEQAFNQLMDRIYDLKIQAYEMEITNQKTQLINLQLQINPHLLLNSLNTIYGLSEMEDYENIQVFTLNLAKYFRYALKDTNELVPVAKELDFVKNYVEIQRVRYPGRFYVIYDVEDDLMGELLPPLIIENFVENSIKYALSAETVEILVIIRKSEGLLRVAVCDDGNGMEPEVLQKLQAGEPYRSEEGVHVGIWNCERRLKIFYGEAASFQITSTVNVGTRAWMEFPCTPPAGKQTESGETG